MDAAHQSPVMLIVRLRLLFMRFIASAVPLTIALPVDPLVIAMKTRTTKVRMS